MGVSLPSEEVDIRPNENPFVGTTAGTQAYNCGLPAACSFL